MLVTSHLVSALFHLLIFLTLGLSLNPDVTDAAKLYVQ